ncbi:hypothetical protein CRG98_007605 [Punica granatum]|uniref:Retrotransposon gag domain-containing protein n=1 Tax=Punica granatum TaxID=22663 RepID=A0A2I0KU42_PUNGR|nr:hypothetical protein CRG98_007605 [Punica granatum]
MDIKEDQTFEAYTAEWRGKAAKHTPLINEEQQVQLFHSTLKGVYYSHLLSHASSFSELIEAGKKLDIGIMLGRIEGPARKKEGEASKKHAARMSRMGKDVTAYHPASPTIIQPPPPQQHTPAQAQQSRASALRPPQSAQRAPTSQVRQGGAAQPRQRKQFTSLPVTPSHIYWQLLTSGKIRLEALCPNFDPTVQNQSIHCEFHQGALGHTLNNCWRLQEKIQEMINAKEMSFNEVKSPNVRATPLPDHGLSSGPTINMTSVCAIAEEDVQESPVLFVIEYVPTEVAVASAPFIIKIYEGSELANKGKTPAVAFQAVPKAAPITVKKVTEEKVETSMKAIKASEYKVVEQMGKSSAHISLLALLLSFKPYREALMKISFVVDELPSAGYRHSWALYIVCKCNNHIVDRMNVDMNCICASKTAVRAFDGSRREVNGEIDLLIDVGLCSFCVTFQTLDIPNAFSLLLARPWIHAADDVPSSLHQKLKFFVKDKLITVNGEEDYAIYKETTVPYISIGEDQSIPFYSFDTISVTQDYI